MAVVLHDVCPLLGAASKFGGVELELGVVVTEGMELVEQERVKTLLEVPGVLLMDDDPTHHENGTASVRPGLINEAQVQAVLPSRPCPAEAGHVLRVSRGASSRNRILRSSPLRSSYTRRSARNKPDAYMRLRLRAPSNRTLRALFQSR